MLCYRLSVGSPSQILLRHWGGGSGPASARPLSECHCGAKASCSFTLGTLPKIHTLLYELAFKHLLGYRLAVKRTNYHAHVTYDLAIRGAGPCFLDQNVIPDSGAVGVVSAFGGTSKAVGPATHVKRHPNTPRD